MSNPIWLIGSGNIGAEYAKVLKSLKQDFLVIGRGAESAELFNSKTGIPVIPGGIDNFLRTNPAISDCAIVAVNIPNLKDTVISLSEAGIRNILVEKPGFLYPDELDVILSVLSSNNTNAYIAYNRRFYSSVIKAEEIIIADGGVTSFNFEFTEWGYILEKLNKTKGELENMLYGNSSHVIDMAFYMGGFPQKLIAYTSGSLSWHKPAIFAGAGVSEKNALFSYQANWDAPGRWGVEVLTKKHRLIFRPLEKLQIQEIGSVEIKFIDIDNHLDVEFKPGFYLQTDAFIKGDTTRLCSYQQQVEHVKKFYSIISNKAL